MGSPNTYNSSLAASLKIIYKRLIIQRSDYERRCENRFSSVKHSIEGEYNRLR